MPHFLSLTFLGTSDRLMVKKLAGEAEAGIYSFVYTVSIVAMIITESINSALVPQIYELLKKKEISRLHKIINQVLLTVGVMAFSLCLVAPEIVKLCSSPEYYDGIPLLPVLCISPYLTFVYSLLANVEYYFGANKLVAVASVISAAANIALNALFIPIYSYFAAGVTTFVCYLLCCIMHFIFTKAVCRKKYDAVKVYDYKAVLLISIATIVLTLSLTFVCDLWQIRCFILVTALVVLFIKRKSLVKLFGDIKGE